MILKEIYQKISMSIYIARILGLCFILFGYDLTTINAFWYASVAALSILQNGQMPYFDHTMMKSLFEETEMPHTIICLREGLDAHLQEYIGVIEMFKTSEVESGMDDTERLFENENE